jgi:chemotaxis receptor (MCP) glutamine deamidase CheD
MAEKELKKLGIRLVHAESGGEEGRKIFINASDCSFRIEKIPRIVGAA